MNIYIGSDHAGFELKNLLVQRHPHFIDIGCKGLDSVDYPDYANLVCEKMKTDPTALGILICGSGQGVCMRANKFSHIRAALVYNDEVTKLSREHNDANVICIGSRFASSENAIKWINIFINTPFSEGRHRQRVDKISQST
ncbi:MAG: ribose 5-phosphate isomerase B [Bdellovibrionaceae bacterium]|nr:ribose 5-phosphate isomerase B [Pseudobdellovibrionaceae bacterium]